MDAQKLDPITRLGANEFAFIGEVSRMKCTYRCCGRVRSCCLLMNRALALAVGATLFMMTCYQLTESVGPVSGFELRQKYLLIQS